MMFVYSDVLEVQFMLQFPSARNSGVLFKDPVIFQRAIDDAQEFTRQGDDGAASSAPAADCFVVAGQVRAVPLGDQRALD